MKFLLVLCDGAADHSLKELGGKTPLEAAEKTNIDSIARKSKMGLLETIPKGMPTGSTIANISVLGYDPIECFEGRPLEGRGYFEAVSRGIKLKKSETAFRCNFINVKNGKMNSHSAGNISSAESKELVDFLNEKIGSSKVKFYAGLSYRNILVAKNASLDIECKQPHDHPGQEIEKLLVKPLEPSAEKTAKLLNELIFKSMKVLPKHPVNKKREKLGNLSANCIWPWAQGAKPAMQSFKKLHGLKGAAISAVDLIKGLAATVGFDVINVGGATGLWDTNYEGKAKAALSALKKYDFVFLHVEAADEASHEGNLELKMKVIKDIDTRLVKPIVEGLKESNEKVAIALLPDHLTPVKERVHERGLVPIMIYKPGQSGDSIESFSEKNAENGSLGKMDGKKFMDEFLSNRDIKSQK